MKTRRLGRNGPEVAQLGLGCMGMSTMYGPSSDEESIATIHAAVENGVTLFDTADTYGDGANEELVGRALRGVRERVVIATKFGNIRNHDGSRTVNGRPEYVRQACEASLQRLGIETIDLYYQHRVDPSVPIEDTIGAMATLVEQGKVRFLGLSEAAPETIRRAHATHPITALQTEYSLFSRQPEIDLLTTVRQLGIGFIAYSPLGRGVLTGRFRSPNDFSSGDWRPNMPRFQGDNLSVNLALVDKLQAFAKVREFTTAQVALAWLLAQGDDIVPIFGTKKLDYLRSNIAASAIALTEQDIAEITSLAPADGVAGARYHASGLSRVDL
ncbi:aldo/keto reductase [Paraburkholderia fungorum]|uniref:aldo/keto reductase n=1 Tax=Paraburkholderia fungorum TaxID=134537 RepID=UPI00402BA229